MNNLLCYLWLRSVAIFVMGFLIPFHSEWFACAYGRCDASRHSIRRLTCDSTKSLAVSAVEVVSVVRSGYE